MSKKKNIGLATILVLLICLFSGLLFVLVRRNQTINEIKDNAEWYDETATEFTLNTAEELYEFKQLSSFHSFKGQTVKLGADIVVNEGNAEEWEKNAPEKKWFPITGFEGTFDGQGHSISGLYGKGTNSAMGLFAKTKMKAVIKNLSLLNSYFETAGNIGVGSIASSGGGTFSRIYSDAIINHTGDNAAGIVSHMKFQTKVSECWYDGKITMTGCSGGGIVDQVDVVNIELEHCLFTGEIYSHFNQGGSRVGGIVGALEGKGSNITITDSLSVGKVGAMQSAYLGSVVGVVYSGGKIVAKDTFASMATHQKTIASVQGKLEGTATTIRENRLRGVEGYRWTSLDFDKYWVAQEGATPMLACFSDTSLSLAGIEKGYDTSWYNETDKEFVIDTVEKFYGFAYLSATNTFEGQTIKLATDISLNEGKASNWAKNAPENVWNPICSEKYFFGTFDGQGHTISGIYAIGDSKIGLFGKTARECTIKNLKIKNSYFEGEYQVGSVIGQGAGTFDSIYSDAILVARLSDGSENENGGRECGGLIGQMDNISKITNCWFAGKMTTDTYSGGIVGNVLPIAEIHIENCLFSGTIKGRREEGTYLHIGGLLGHIGGVKDNVKKVTIKDCMCSGRITGMDKATRVGSVAGYINAYRQPVMTDIYATNECYQQQGYAPFAGVYGNALVTAQLLPKDQYTGYNALKLTLLNFDKYWVAISNSTPQLKRFATGNKLNTNGVMKADTSWYDKSKDDYTISDIGDLLGFALLSKREDFEGKNFKLANDIVFNTGKSSDWAENRPELTWIPIGQMKTFKGNFDGQGHTISGLYATGNMTGFFGKVGEGVKIQNLEIANSYFTGECQIGGIVGKGSGTYSNIYVHEDVILVAQKVKGSTNANGGRECGGIIGQADMDTVIKNCWFAGQITTDTYSGGLIGNFNRVFATLKIDSCLFSGSIIGRMDEGVNKIGGFVGNVASSNQTPKKVSMEVRNSLSSGEIKGINKSSHVGSAFGVIGKERVYEITRTYVTEECYKQQGTVAFTGAHNSRQISAVKKYPKADLINYGACKVTLLDFDKYWSAKADNTPELKKFSEGLSLEGVVRADISWYNEQKNNYTISDAGDLIGLMLLSMEENFEGKNFKLGGDIALNTGASSDWATNKPKITWIPIGQTNTFKGNFDGQGHTISGLYSKGDISGLFGKVDAGVKIQNLEIANSYFTGEYQIGSVVGKGSGIYSNIYVHEDVILVAQNAEGSTNANGGRECGGIIGQADGKMTMTNCWFAGQITTDTYSGGLIGNFTNVGATLTVENCLVTGTIEGRRNTEGAHLVGGFVGYIAGAKTKADKDASIVITDSLNAGSVTGMNKAIRVGSIFGQISEYRMYELNAVYATSESYRQQGTVPFAGAYGSKKIDEVQFYAADLLKGIGGYQYTTLDFEECWAAIANKTPELKQFSTENALSVAGKPRIDVGWYGDGSADEFVISNASELLGFSHLSQSVNFKGKTIKLANDIELNSGDAADWADNAPDVSWMPAGGSVYFFGTFDGQGHTISGLYAKDTRSVGLFSRTAKECTIRNLVLKNSYFEGVFRVAGISGEGAGTIESVYCDAIISAKDSASPNGGRECGGFIGCMDNTTTISNSWFAGTMNIDTYSGGFVGNRTNRSLGLTLNNCLMTGTINSNTTTATALNIGGLVACNVSNSVKITDTMFLGRIITNASGTTNVGSLAGATSTHATCTDVYASTQDTEVTVGGAATDPNGVTKLAETHLTGDAAQINASGLDWANTWIAVQGQKPALRKFMSEVEGTFIDTSWYGDGSASEFTLMDAEDLLGFAYLLKTNYFKDKTVKLGSNIALNTGDSSEWAETAPEVNWPINGTTYFMGTFDGQGHTISGLYAKDTRSVGLFSKTAKECTIKNLILKNSYFEATYRAAGIAGEGAGTIESVYCDVIINAKDSSADNGGRECGGFIGYMDNTTTISNSWFAGTMNIDTYSGGFVGNRNSTSVGLTINNCLMTGTINSSTTKVTELYIGGLVGRKVTSNVNITDTMFLGRITTKASGSTKVGSLVGETGTHATCTDVYASTKDTAVTVGSASTDPSGVTKRTEAQLMGDAAQTNASGLDWTNTWIAVQGQKPALRKFMSEVEGTCIDTSWYGDGSASEFTLMDAEDLLGFAYLLKTNYFKDKTVKLGANIALNTGDSSEWAETAPEVNWPINGTTYFMGTFDGQGHTISGLYAKDTRSVGLFSKTAKECTIKNLILKNSYFEAAFRAAGIAGEGAAKIESVYCDVIISAKDSSSTNGGRECGGFIGYMDNTTTISNSWFAGTMNIDTYSGGFVGNRYSRSLELTMNNCLMTGTINSNTTTATALCIGGLVGNNVSSSVKITDSMFLGRITTKASGATKVGSLVGETGTHATCTDVYASMKDREVTVGSASTDPSGVTKLTEAQLIGDAAQTNAGGLDWTNTWIAVQEKKPALRKFMSEVVGIFIEE